MRLDRLPPRDEDGNVRVVVEAPRGARVKMKLDAELGVITLGRPLPLGLAYPYDWGFVPGTRAPDGDPLDAMVLHDAPTYPGVVIPCALVGVVRVDQREKKQRVRNDRVIAVPIDAPRLEETRDVRDLPKRVRAELERFFETATLFTGKDVRLLGWGDAKEAEALVARVKTRRR